MVEELRENSLNGKEFVNETTNQSSIHLPMRLKLHEHTEEGGQKQAEKKMEYCTMLPVSLLYTLHGRSGLDEFAKGRKMAIN